MTRRRCAAPCGRWRCYRRSKCALGLTKAYSPLKRAATTVATYAIRDHLFWGVGWGSFGRFYPRYMLATAFEKIQDPHNFLMETWACGGLLAALVLLGTLAAFVGRGAWRSGRLQAEEETRPAAAGRRSYRGRRCGADPGLPAAGRRRGVGRDLHRRGPVGRPGRCLVFGIRRLHELAQHWSRPAAGHGHRRHTALLCNLLISAGIAQASVAQPLWSVAALALPVSATARSEAWLFPEPAWQGQPCWCWHSVFSSMNRSGGSML